VESHCKIRLTQDDEVSNATLCVGYVIDSTEPLLHPSTLEHHQEQYLVEGGGGGGTVLRGTGGYRRNVLLDSNVMNRTSKYYNSRSYVLPGWDVAVEEYVEVTASGVR